MGEVKMIPRQSFLVFLSFHFLTILTGKCFKSLFQSLIFYSQSSFWLTLLISWNVLADIQMFHSNSSASAIFIFPKEEF